MHGVTSYSALKEKLVIYEKIKSKSKVVRKYRVSYQQKATPVKKTLYYIRPHCKMQNNMNTDANYGSEMAAGRRGLN